MTVRRLWAPLVGLGCALVLLVSALSHLPASAHELSRRRTVAQHVPVISGIPKVGGLPAGTPEFLHRVRELSPEFGKIRVLVGPRRSCSAHLGQLYWVNYQLAPRVTVCDPAARYWLLVSTGPLTLPAGSRVVLRPNPALQFIDTRPGAS